MEILITLFFSIGINILMFIPAYIFKTDKLTDISYAVTFAAIAIYGFVLNTITIASIILFLMILIWSIRLGSYLLIRINKMGKDSRFDGMREDFFRFLKFWFFQGLTVFVILLPSILFFNNENELPFYAYIGAVIWLIGILIEGIADYQKYKFINNPSNKGKWIETGLWKYSRHPNYFGEILLWLGVYIFVFSGLTTLQALIGIVSPLYIFFIIVFISGIPLLEKGADKRWGEDEKYKEYKDKTSILIPLPRK